MPANFDWQTEEDDRRMQASLWDLPPETQGDEKSRRRPPWRLIGLVAALVIMVGAIIWWRVDRRIDATVQAFRSDVIASHNLMQRAVAESDEEVFRSVLSGRMPAWTAGELEVFAAQLVYDRSPFGLIPVEGSLPVILPEPDEETPAGERSAAIEFSPDLNEAVVSVEHPYRRETTNETLVLRQTTVFRRGDFRWLLAPPMDEFWGEWITREGEHLSLIYPRRDAEIAVRLADEIDGEIKRLCVTLDDIECSADLHLTVRLDTDPVTLAVLSQPLGALRRAREREDILELPTPTLVGLPIEDDPSLAEAGYEALRDGYARHILGAAIAQAVGWQCCDDSLIFNYLVEYQLSEMGLLEWPVGENDYRRILDSRPRLSDISSYIRGRVPIQLSAERLWELRAAVDFLVKGIPGTSPSELQRVLDRTSSFNEFLDRVVSQSAADSDTSMLAGLDMAWWLFAFNSLNATAGDSPPPLPGEELYMACTALDGNQSFDSSILLRYQPHNEKWDELYRLQGFIWMSSLPEPKTLLMQEFAVENEAWRTNLWRNGGISTAYLPPATGEYAISFGETDPAGKTMIAYTFEPQMEIIQGFRIDLTNCAESCQTSEIPGRPRWSPNGEWAVYMGDNASFPEDLLITANDRHILLQSLDTPRPQSLALGAGDTTPDSPALIPIGEGRSPFWLDNQTFGFIKRITTDGPLVLAEDEIVLASLDNPIPATLVTAADIIEFLPGDYPPRRISIAYVATHPNWPDILFIVVLDQRDQRAYIVHYDLETRLAEVRLDLIYNLNHSLSFSPDGRYLVLTGQDRNVVVSNDDNAVMLVHDIAANTTIPLMTRLPFFLPSVVYDWTEDSRWLAVAMDDNLIGLIAPDEGYTRMLPHGYGACTSVAWLQP